MDYIFSLISYLFGSIPFGMIFTKLAGLEDVRTIGSGNIGATNVLRTGNKKVAFFTLLFDGLKGFIPVTLALWLAPKVLFLCALLCVLGHIFPVWLKFKGGKGVATALGVCFALYWPLGFFIAAVWLFSAKFTKLSSLSALLSFSLLPIFTAALSYFHLLSIKYFIFTLVVAIIINVTHKENWKRLWLGIESPINIGKNI